MRSKIASFDLTQFVGVQPDDPAQLGGKIYEMMGMALSGKWSDPSQFQPTQTQSHIPETVEAEVVDPTEAGSQKWKIEIFALLHTGKIIFLNIGGSIL